jgi:crotonobetainyl-CoA:carnitine CoA-transferase CaiB-like acyl-CoA transferase
MSAFSGLRIIDLTRILSGPFCTMYFADLGAEVIKIEPPGGDDTRTWGPPFINGESAYFLSVNRNKKSVVLDLKTDEGKRVLRKMIVNADVVVENFRPGTLEKLGFGFETLKTLNPSIILASISGFGQTGPYRNEPGYDVIAQGMGGLMSVTGPPDGEPVKPGFSLADVSAGMWAIIGILTALQKRQQSPEAQWIDVSLLESIIAFQTYVAGNYFATGKNPVPMGNAHPNICPYQAFPASDGYFNIAVGNDRLWEKFCDGIGRPEWVDDERFRTNPDRVRNRGVLIPLLEELFHSKTVSEWVNLFRSRGIPCGPIYRLSELYNDPFVRERDMLFTVEHPIAGTVRQVGVPVKFLTDSNDKPLASPPPILGQHTEEILCAFGLPSVRT